MRMQRAAPGNVASQEEDLEQLVHLRAKNALWRSWSIEGLSEKAREEPEGARKGSGFKASPKAWELFYESFLLDIGNSSMVTELSRRHHGFSDTTGCDTKGGMNTGIPPLSPAPTPTCAPTPAPAPAPMTPSMSGWDGVEGGVRGGHVFGYLAGKSGSSGGTDVGEDGGQFLALSRESSGVSDLIFGMETSGSYDRPPRRGRTASVGSAENSETSNWGNGPRTASPSDTTLGETMQDTRREVKERGTGGSR